jgi:hypothetical protein
MMSAPVACAAMKEFQQIRENLSSAVVEVSIVPLRAEHSRSSKTERNR